jgi:hypothetical protein
MKSQAVLLGVKQATLSPESDLWRHAAVRPLADHETPLAEHQVPRVDGRDFGQVPVHASGPDGGHAEVSCPLSPRRCPFGGACHTCPLPVQAKRVEGQAQNVPEQVPPIVHEVLRSPGQPLDPATRAFMEPRFGHDFGGVRVHIDTKAAESAQAINALAYTVGHDIVLGTGRYAPGMTSGKRLLAHELTHVVQQSRTSSAGRNLRIGMPGDAFEQEADRGAATVLSGSGTLSVTQRSPALWLRRQVDPIVCTVLQEERRSDTWNTILRYNAITGNPPGRNIIAKRSDGTNFDLNWALDVAWVAGESGGDCSAIVGTVFGRLGEVFCAGVGYAAGGMSYWFARLIGAVVEGFVNGPAAGWRYLTSGSVNEENLNGADVGMQLGASGAIGGGARQIRDFVHQRVRQACGV